MFQFCALKIVVFAAFLSLNSCDDSPNKRNSTWTDILKRDLLVNYDKFVRPMDHESTTKVNLALTVKHIDLDEQKGVMSVFGWIKMEWQDNKLFWNASDYGNLNSIHLADHEVWQPDLTLYNSALGNTIDHYANTMAIVSNTGSVIWVPPFQFQVFCEFDLRFWPYDQQTCEIWLGSWVYNGLQIDLAISEYGTEIDMFIANHEWKIKNITASRNSTYYDCCAEPYVSNTYTITVERRSPIYKTVVITPATCVILMTLAAFWLPPQSGEKIILNGINIIMISIFMMYFGQKLPVMAIHTPLVVLFYSSSLYLVSFSMIISVIVNFCATSKHTIKVSRLIKNVLDGWLGNILVLGHLNYNKGQNLQRDAELRDQPFEDNITADNRQIIDNSLKTNIQHDWLILATAIDRIFFLVYCLVFIILAVVYSV